MQEKTQNKLIVKKNIAKVIELKGITEYKFYKETGITRGVLKQNNGISEENIAKFLAYFPDIDANWLITGEGEMCRQIDDNSAETNDKISRLITILEETLKEKDKQIEKLMSIIEQGK